MQSRTRIMEAIQGGSPDRMPVSPFTLGALDFLSAMAQELIAETDPLVRTTGGIDPFIGSAVTQRVVQDGNTTVTSLITPKGELTTRWRKTSITEAPVEYGIKTLEDAERFLSMPYSCDGVDPSAYYKWCSRIGNEGLVLVEVPNAICLPAQWLSPEDFCVWTLDYPELVLELTRVGSERVSEYVDRLCREGVEAFRIIGAEYAVTQLGPTGFDKLVAQFDAELVDLIHSHGAIAYYHCHGCVTAYLEKLADIGMDALDPLEAAPWGDTEIGEAVRKMDGRVCLVGNLDDMEIINALPTQQVLEIAEERLLAAGDSRFILGGTASGTYTEHGARNFIAMADMVRDRTRSAAASVNTTELSLVR